jgi:hypothetical protein
MEGTALQKMQDNQPRLLERLQNQSSKVGEMGGVSNRVLTMDLP